MSKEIKAKGCPSCGRGGRRVSALTLSSQLTEEAQGHLASAEGYSFCPNSDCEVSYFGSVTFTVRDVQVFIFQKSDDPKRLACYCFGHSVEEIEQEILKTGASSIPIAIRDNCKKGLDECEKNNPQGSCCLGNVSRVVKNAQASADKESQESCCSTSEIRK